MKHLITLLILIVGMTAFGTGAEAQARTKKKKATTSASINFDTTRDGYADIGGPTYQATIQGVKMTLTFEPYNGTNGVVHIKFSGHGTTEEELNNWYYLGGGRIMCYMGLDNQEIYYEIRNGGKELYNDVGNLTFKAIR